MGLLERYLQIAVSRKACCSKTTDLFVFPIEKIFDSCKDLYVFRDLEKRSGDGDLRRRRPHRNGEHGGEQEYQTFHGCTSPVDD